MIKAEFVAAVARESALTAAQVSKALEGIEEVCARELKAQGAVRIPGVVKITRLARDARLVRNPRSGEEFVMGACTLVKAKPVPTFADRIKKENPVGG